MAEPISIVYFSGTGGTEQIARAFDHSLRERRYDCHLIPLDQSKWAQRTLASENRDAISNSRRVILVFAVHAFDAPDPVYRWLEQTNGNGKRIAVISVSGGGELWPNTGCRNRIIRLLEERGFELDYEKMMVMPCNWVVPTNDHLAMHLLNAIPEKVGKILDNLMTGQKRRVRHRLGWFRKGIRYLEKMGARTFARSLEVTDSCTACGWCVDHCPVNNIGLANRRPVFGLDCVMCFRCIYGCPILALRSKNFMVLKQGFSLEKLRKRMVGVKLHTLDDCCKGILWAGVKKYLNDTDGY